MRQLSETIEAMKNCPQTEGQSVYDHGVSVRSHLEALIDHMRAGTHLDGWRLPNWLQTYREALLAALLPDGVLKTYALFHDAGKPFCLVVDENGRRHFPNHARVSYETWMDLDGDEQVGQLILHDMDCHLLKADGVEEFCKMPEAASLLLTALAEIHSNAKMFGGISSVSFLIKWKQLDKRGKQICKMLFPTVNA